MRFSAVVLLSLAWWCGAASGYAQPPQLPAQSAPAPTYDVATIKANTSGSGKVDIWTHEDSYVASNVALRAFLQDAFDVQKSLIVGLPPWAESARWDLNAKATELSRAQLQALTTVDRREMLRRLLEDRFALRWHRATEVRPVYLLVVDRSGAKIQHTAPAQAPAGGDGEHGTNGEIGIQNVGLDAFCKELSGRLERPVIDRTGLAGNYTLLVRFTPESVVARAGEAGLPADAPPPLFTALPEQLGLRLEAGKGPVEVLVIDGIALPSAN